MRKRNVADPWGSRSQSNVRKPSPAASAARFTAADVLPTPPLMLYVAMTFTTATFWYLDFDSELIYVGDSGSTEEGPASRRLGVEITNYVYPHPWLRMDLDVSFSRARFRDVPDGEDFVPGALNRVISGGVSVNPPAGVGAGGQCGDPEHETGVDVEYHAQDDHRLVGDLHGV